MTDLIGFMGISRSGKTTAAKMLIEARGGVMCSFSDPFKNMLRVLYREACIFGDHNVERRIEGDLKDVSDPAMFNKTPRDLMILIAETMREQVDPRIWVELARRQMLGKHLEGAPVIVFPDVRKAIEVEMIKHHRGKIVMVTGRGHHSGDVTDDVPELLADVTIRNDGTLDDLREQVLAL